MRKVATVTGVVLSAVVFDRFFHPEATPTTKVLSSLNSIDAELEYFHHEIARLKSIETDLKHRGEVISQLLEVVGKKG
jgi:hypothetical protein